MLSGVDTEELKRVFEEKLPVFNPLNAELNPIRHLLALVGARHIDHVSRIRVKMEERQADRSVVCLEMFSVSWRHVYKLPGWALRLLVEVS